MNDRFASSSQRTTTTNNNEQQQDQIQPARRFEAAAARRATVDTKLARKRRKGSQTSKFSSGQFTAANLSLKLRGLDFVFLFFTWTTQGCKPILVFFFSQFKGACYVHAPAYGALPVDNSTTKQANALKFNTTLHFVRDESIVSGAFTHQMSAGNPTILLSKNSGATASDGQ